MCTANGVASPNARFREAVGRRTHVPNEQALKALDLVAVERRPNRSDPAKVNGWKTVLNAVSIRYGNGTTAAN